MSPLYQVHVHPEFYNDCTVEAIEVIDGHAYCYTARFSGPLAEVRAKEYAKFKNAQRD